MTLINDLRLCGRMPNWWPWKRLFYAIKDAVLSEYGYFDGYDLHVWYDADWYDEYSGDSARQHNHILQRWILNGEVFHKPTDEFLYINWNYGARKESPGYHDLLQKITGQFDGKRTPDRSAEGQAAAWAALKRLVSEHKLLVRRGSAQPLLFQDAPKREQAVQEAFA